MLINHLDDILPSARALGANLILAGDFNVHNRNWLHRSKTTPAGEALEDTCTAHFLTQHVQCPTRGDNTLDLVMSTLNSPVTTQIMPLIGRSDDTVILSDFTGVLPSHEPAVQRTVWRYEMSDWNRLRSFFRQVDWSTVITANPETSCHQVTDTITKAVSRFVPSKTLTVKLTDPKWWTPECAAAMKEKNKRWRTWRQHPHDFALKHEFTRSVNNAIAVLTRSRVSKENSLGHSLSNGSLKKKEWWTKLKCACGGVGTLTFPCLLIVKVARGPQALRNRRLSHGSFRRNAVYQAATLLRWIYRTPHSLVHLH